MPTHKINADLDVDGEVQGTSLDINGAADISGNVTLSGTITVPTDIIHSGDTDTMIKFTNDNIRIEKI